MISFERVGDLDDVKFINIIVIIDGCVIDELEEVFVNVVVRLDCVDVVLL